MSISAVMVKELREKTGAGMMDCKTALTETNGDMEAAVDWLRKKGISKAAKKAGRVAAEGLIGVSSDGSKSAIVEVNSETDFVARNENFQNLVSGIARVAVNSADANEVANVKFPDSDKTVSEQIQESISTIGENISLRRIESLSASGGIVASYIHNAVSEGLGKIGVLVAVESDADAGKLSEFGRKIAMHIAAAKPLSLNLEQLDPSEVSKEREVLSEQARESGKPEDIIEKMVDGRMHKFYKDVVLLKQDFVVNPDISVEKAIEEFAKENDTDVKITSFVRFELGEGIEKEETDFASEVAAATS